MKSTLNSKGDTIFHIDEDTACVLKKSDLVRINQKTLDKIVTVYLYKDEIIQLAEELKKR
jgi:hypothetical protein